MTQQNRADAEWNQPRNRASRETMAAQPDAAGKLAVQLAAHVGGVARIVVDTGHGSLACAVVEGDSIACQLEELRLTTSRLADAEMPRLEQISRDLAARVTYLLEAVGPIESDAQGMTVQMRSIPPYKEKVETEYYELVVRAGGHLRFGRYRQPARGDRRSVPATLTKEVVARLAADFIHSVE